MDIFERHAHDATRARAPDRLAFMAKRTYWSSLALPITNSKLNSTEWSAIDRFRNAISEIENSSRLISIDCSEFLFVFSSPFGLYRVRKVTPNWRIGSFIRRRIGGFSHCGHFFQRPYVCLLFSKIFTFPPLTLKSTNSRPTKVHSAAIFFSPDFVVVCALSSIDQGKKTATVELYG